MIYNKLVQIYDSIENLYRFLFLAKLLLPKMKQQRVFLYLCPKIN